MNNRRDPRGGSVPPFECLEQRSMFAAVAWDGGAGTNLWTDALNWTGDVVPGPDDDVTIADTPHSRIEFNRILTPNVVTAAIRSLVTSERLVLGINATLQVETSVQASADIALEGGVIRGGSYAFSGAATFVFNAAIQNRLQDVTLNSDLLMSNGSRLGVLGQLTLPAQGRIRFVGANPSHLYFQGDTTIARDVSFESTSLTRSTLGTLSGGLLTIAQGVTVSGGSATVGATLDSFGATSLVNNGVIRCTNRTIVVDPFARTGLSTSFVNHGSLQVAGGRIDAFDVAVDAGSLSVAGGILNINGVAPFVMGNAIASGGGRLVVGGSFTVPSTSNVSVSGANTTTILGSTTGSWSSEAVISISAGAAMTIESNSAGWSNRGAIVVDTATLQVRGHVTTSGLGSISTLGSAQVYLGCVLDNTGTTLNIDSSRSRWRTSGATIRGGVLALSAPDALFFTGEFPTFSTVTLDGVTLPHDVVLQNSMSVGILNGITLPVGGRFQLLDDTLCILSFDGPAATVLYDVDLGTHGRLAPPSIVSTLTIPTGVTVSGRAGTIGDGSSGLFTLVNYGTIRAQAPIDNRTMSLGTFVTSGALINHGTIEAVEAGGFFMDFALVNEADGTVNIGAGSQFTVGGTFRGPRGMTNRGSITAQPGATLTTYTQQGGFSNTGVISLNAATLSLTGSLDSFGLGTILNQGGNLFLRGTLLNTSQSFRITAILGPLILDGGGIVGGTIIPDSPSLIRFTSLGSYFQSTRLESDLILDNGANLTLTFGVTLNPTAAIRFTGNTPSILQAYGNTFNLLNNVSFESTGTQPSRLSVVSGDGRLNIASGVTVSGGNGVLGRANIANIITNNGVIRATREGQSLTVDPGFSFTNNGTIEAANGGTLAVFGLTNYTVATRRIAGGTYRAGQGSTLSMNGGVPISTIASGTAISLEGPTAALAGDALAALENIQGSLALSVGKSLVITPASGFLTNSGTLNLSTGARLSVAALAQGGGNFTQGTSGILAITLSPEAFVPNFRFVSAVGNASFAGSLTVQRSDQFAPRPGSLVQLVGATQRSGMFANVSIAGYLGMPGFGAVEYEGGARLSIGDRSPDFNGDGILNADDLADFINVFFADPGSPAADFNSDGLRDADDLADFINAYFAG